MAHAQYETRTRTVEETVVVLELTEDEADELRDVLGESDGTPTRVRILAALQKPEPSKAEEPASTFEYGGVVYDLTATYRDDEGDAWRFTGETHSDGSPKLHCAGSYRTEIGDVLAAFGPLTKVPAP
ncbi:phiSA1p31-related protein [Streptomyces sp. NPDC057217]|uniref:phiSA1p31-related protein n=1 Tax=Streptomyces sp. NPDC057217 TaxID=3346054 RepID=UPI003642F0BF